MDAAPARPTVDASGPPPGAETDAAGPDLGWPAGTVVRRVEVSAGTLTYVDTGGTGPVLLFTHGLLMDASQWAAVIARLRDSFRCVALTLPLGGHPIPMRPDADLSLAAIPQLIEEFAEALDLRDVTLVQNDWGGAQVLIAIGRPVRIARMVLTSCEAFDNYPPAVARPIVLLARIPGGLRFFMALLRLRVIRRAPGAWGWMSKRPVPTELMNGWFGPATESAAVRRDLAKYVTSVPSREILLTWASRSAAFTGPVLIVWAAEDKVMPPEHGRRLAELFPNGRLVEIADSYTLIPQDQPALLAGHIRDFMTAR
jgi:pimeloyl-ACP methyl ester carboxylesterase